MELTCTLLILHTNRGMDTLGLRELVAANPEHVELESQVETKEVKKLMEEPGLSGITSLLTQPSNSFMDTQEEFYDALMIEDPEEEEEEKAAQGKFAKRVGDKSSRTSNLTLFKPFVSAGQHADLSKNLPTQIVQRLNLSKN